MLAATCHIYSFTSRPWQRTKLSKEAKVRGETKIVLMPPIGIMCSYSQSHDSSLFMYFALFMRKKIAMDYMKQ